MRIMLDTAKALLLAAEKKAREIGVSEDIAIVDEGGNLIAFHRMDYARIAGIDIALNKAWTSVAMKMPTVNLSQAALPGGPSFGINTTNNGRIVILGGGIPLIKDGRIYGGVGVSGGTSDQDIEVATAAVQAYDSMRAADSPRPLQARIGSYTQNT
ncbi:heme-binding protein [Paenibacillus sepulcri]|uniref:Heme-binding protein n=1 Tax=Paenibacillus sepulcri TaxID=359917 RepID=A0ABS7C8E9_9BACL|nr:heme-binding protein [Paenibacillus sepulcri]